MNKISDWARRAWMFAAAATFAVVVAAAPAAAQEQQPNVTANADGSCVYHKSVGGGVREDILVANGATYHQEAFKGKKSGIVYVPDRTWLCKDGHFTKAE